LNLQNIEIHSAQLHNKDIASRHATMAKELGPEISASGPKPKPVNRENLY